MRRFPPFRSPRYLSPFPNVGRTTITIAHRLSTIKDAHQIFVMGDGLVLQQGTHSELLRDENGAYARLVHAQKLRESTETQDSELSSARASMDVEKKLREEQTINRKDTSRSLASEIMEKKKTLDPESGARETMPGFWYLIARMAMINKEAWRIYLVGAFFASRAYLWLLYRCSRLRCLLWSVTGLVYPAFGIVFGASLPTM